MYNALTITAFLEESDSTAVIIIGVVGVLASLFVYHLLEEHLEKSDLSGAVFYHEFFVSTQSFYTVVSFLTVPVSLAHLFLLGYFLTFA